MSDIVERVYRAMRAIRADGLPVDRFTIKVNPKARDEVRRDLQDRIAFRVHTAEVERMFGLPFETDPWLEEDRIVLFYEVEA